MAVLPATVTTPGSIPPPLESLKDRRAVVVGLGRSGLAAAELLLREGADVWAYDDTPEVLLRIPESIAPALEGRASNPESLPDQLDFAITSPGVAPTGPLFTFFIHHGIPWYSELELGAALCQRPIVAITGTNGKTTVTTMIDHVLRGCGLSSEAAGNVGLPFSRLVLDERASGPGPVVLEISSFQLEASYRFHPNIAVITNLAPDHLDRYVSTHAYYETKSLIAANQTRNDDLWVGPGVLDTLYPVTEAELFLFQDRQHSEEGLGWDGDAIHDRRGTWPEEYTWPYGRTLLPQHLQNAMAALGACLSVGLSVRQVMEHLESYVWQRHRLEFVATVRGVTCYDDSKATNVHAVCAALDSLPGPVRLIAGGRHKGDDLSPLTKRLLDKVAGVYLIGEAAEMMAKLWGEIVPVRMSETVDQAVRHAMDDANESDQVLLSPACTSWDQFPDYAARGDAFCAAVRRFEEEEAPQP